MYIHVWKVANRAEVYNTQTPGWQDHLHACMYFCQFHNSTISYN